MRHFPSPCLIRALPVSVVPAAEPTSLVPLPDLALLAPPRRGRACARAVPLAAVAPPADEEDLPAVGAVADDEAQRVHGSGRDRQELDAVPEPCDEHLVDAGSGRTA